LRHGTGISEILTLLRQRPELAARIDEHAPFVLAEAVHAVQAEMAATLDDVARRRMPLSLLVSGEAWRQRLQPYLDATRAR